MCSDEAADRSDTNNNTASSVLLQISPILPTLYIYQKDTIITETAQNTPQQIVLLRKAGLTEFLGLNNRDGKGR